MVYEITQTKTNFDLQWIVSDLNNTRICVVTAPYKGVLFDALINFANNVSYRMYFNISDKSYGSSFKDLMSFKIFDDKNNLIGKFVGETYRPKGKLFGGYVYYSLNIYNSHYVVYEVGRGAEGVALCIYENDKLVAICDKNPRVTNFKDRYRIYCEESKYIYISTLFSIYYDMAKNADLREIKLYSETVTYTVNTNKEVAAKYDPEFVERCIKYSNGL